MKKITEIVSVNLLIVFFSILILPLLFLFFFNHPSSDDWAPGVNNQSYGFWQAQHNAYKYWTGKFFSTAVLSFNPLYLNSIFGYKLMTLTLMLLFIYVLFAFISEYTATILLFKEKLLITLAVFFLYVYSMPSLAQSFYWLTASVVYQLSLMLIMIFILLYKKLSSTYKLKNKIVLTVFSSLALIFLGGCSEMGMVMGVVTIAVLLMYNLFIQKKITASLIIFAVSIGISAYVLISSPGNKVRSELYPDSHQLLPSLQITVSTLGEYMMTWIFITPLLFVTLLLIPLTNKIIQNKEVSFQKIYLNPFITIPVFIIILFGLFFTPVWSLGKQPFNRTVNIIYFVFLAGWFYNLFVLMNYSRLKFNFNYSGIPKFVYLIALIIVAGFLIKKNNVRLAYADLLRGGASGYNIELNQRYDYILQNTSDSIRVSPLINLPRTIYLADISEDPEAVLNKNYARYFKKKSIALIREDTLNRK